jgi:hypothetical protein
VVVLTWQAKVLLAGIVAAVIWFNSSGNTNASAARELAALPSCEIAGRYVSWRLAFEDGLPSGTSSIQGANLTTFVDTSALYDRATTIALGRESSRTLETLRRVTSHDKVRRNEMLADTQPFIAAFLAECPQEAFRALGGS